MQASSHAFPENSLVGSCLRLAQTTFFQELPANVATMPARAPATFPASKQDGGSVFARCAEALENWLYRQRLKDREAVIRSLVVAGSGAALMREDLAREAVAAGELVLWGSERLETTLWFLYLRRRENDPEIRALLDVLRRVWSSARTTKRAPG